MLQKIINLGTYLIVLLLPLYLVSFKVGWLPVNVLEIMIGALFIVWLTQKNIRPLASNIFYPVFLIFLGVTMATWFSDDLITSAGIWKSWFIIPVLFALVVFNTIRNKDQTKNIIFALFLSGAGVALIALWYWLNGNLTYDGRLRAFYLSPNHLAMYLSPILILSLYLFPYLKKNTYQIIFSLAFGLIFIIIYLTYSWGAWLGVIAGLFFIAVIKNKKIALILFLAAILIFSLQNFSSKLPSLKSRLVIWQSSWEIIKDHSLIGIGPGMFQKYYLNYQAKFPPYLEWAVPQPHNLLLAFWLQAGLLGLIGFIWLLFQFLRKFNKSSLIVAAAMICILVHGLVETTYWKNDLSIIFWLLIALSYKGVHFSD